VSAARPGNPARATRRPADEESNRALEDWRSREEEGDEMPSLKQKLQFIMDGGAVVRYHARSGIKPDTDAHHSHGVAMLASLLAGEDEDGRTKASSSLIMACLTHDLAEQWASDVSAGTKAALGLSLALGEAEKGKLREYGLCYHDGLDPEEAAVLGLADQLDCLMYCLRELSLGNRNVLLVWRRTCARLESMAGAASLDTALRASQVYEALKEAYREVTGPGGPEFDVYAPPNDGEPKAPKRQRAPQTAQSRAV
jgi:5'-deoxynucleotidase YfbR-like HD superfamily hydrolase